MAPSLPQAKKASRYSTPFVRDDAHPVAAGHPGRAPQPVRQAVGALVQLPVGEAAGLPLGHVDHGQRVGPVAFAALQPVTDVHRTCLSPRLSARQGPTLPLSSPLSARGRGRGVGSESGRDGARRKGPHRARSARALTTSPGRRLRIIVLPSPVPTGHELPARPRACGKRPTTPPSCRFGSSCPGGYVPLLPPTPTGIRPPPSPCRRRWRRRPPYRRLRAHACSTASSSAIGMQAEPV